MRAAVAILILGVLCAALPAAAFGQSAGDEQYTDPFAEQGPAPGEEAPAEEEPAAPPSGTAEPAPGGDGSSAEPAPAAESAQATSPTLPRTGAPVVLFAAAGYALLLAGFAIRRQT